MSQHKQIFHSDTPPTRWKAFLWSMRIIIFLLVLSLVTTGIALFRNSNPQMPKLISVDAFKPMGKSEEPLQFKNAPKKKAHHNIARKAPIKAQVRAGFYVNWDLQSYYTLRANISKLNMIVPQWLSVDPRADTIIVDIDPKAFTLMDTSQAKILPLLTNNYKDQWNDSCIDRIISSPVKRTAFIKQLMCIIRKYTFDGVSIDFEELNSMVGSQDLVEFHHQLYDSMHVNHLLATQCIPPFNNDYKLSELHKFNDYIFIMAYDQHFPESKPGPVSDGKWVEQVLDEFTGKIDPDKLILCIAGFGYDWVKDGNLRGVDIAYEEAMTLAKENDSKIKFDDNGYNLYFDYEDETNRMHEVWFADAATNYNIMRTGANYGIAGIALWRLGAEDSRLWDFYKMNLDDESLKTNPLDLEEFSRVKPLTSIDYIDEGEVLDILSSPEEGKIISEYDIKDGLISEETYVTLPSSYVIKKFGKANPKDIYLTFDDGPDAKYTPEILDILKEENVPAAFFLVGENAQANVMLVKREFNEGFEIGNHTFTHPNIADVSIDRARLEMNATRRLIEIITGHSTVMFRPPFNADAEPQDMAEIIPVEESRKENYITIGESIDPQDWDVHGQNGAPVNADSIMDRIIRELPLGNVILLHDAGGDRSATVEALPKIIQYFKERGYRFANISDLVGKTKDDLMPAVTNPKEKALNSANFALVASISFLGHCLFGLFFIGIFLAIGRMVFMGIFATIQFGRSKREKSTGLPTPPPFVSIIVPAFNENVNAVRTVTNLLKTDYPAFEILFIDDGSKDDTFKIVSEAFKGNAKVTVVTKPNGGKASALNYGIQLAKGEIVVCIDADTQLMSNAVSMLVERFTDEDVGAVAGNVKVGNLVNMLTKWQSIEYTTAQNFDRKAFDILNCITVVPGAIGAFRKTAIEDAGGFTSDTLAEDCDLTIRILRCGYKITTNNKAIAMTESPEKMDQFLRQRFRWCFGVMQTFWKNREACFNSEYKALGWVALPNILIFQIILPLFAPLVDLLMIASLILISYKYGVYKLGHGEYPQMDLDNAINIGTYYLIFQLVDLAGAILAFSFERENIIKLWMLIPQRFVYRWLMYYILFKAVGRALRGELQHWGVLKRTGNVKVT